jgi:hypothetical protein
VALFLSAEWLGQLEEALGDLCVPGREEGLSLQQVVRAPGGERAYAILIGPGGTRVRPGRLEHPDVVVSEDMDTARAVARGELSAQAALREGRIRIRGDVARFLALLGALAPADDRLRSLQAQTAF